MKIDEEIIFRSRKIFTVHGTPLIRRGVNEMRLFNLNICRNRKSSRMENSQQGKKRFRPERCLRMIINLPTRFKVRDDLLMVI